MSRLISDSYMYRAIGAEINGACGKCGVGRSDCMCQSLSRMDVCGIIDDAPTVDAVPKWTMLKDKMPNPHTNVLVSGIEAINNSRVYKVMVNDNGTLRPTDYAPSIRWDYWMPFEEPNCGAKMFANDTNAPNKKGEDDE